MHKILSLYLYWLTSARPLKNKQITVARQFQEFLSNVQVFYSSAYFNSNIYPKNLLSKFTLQLAPEGFLKKIVENF